VYVSGHGFGHATRTGEVLRVLRERAPDLEVAVTSGAPAFLFEEAVPPPLEVRHRVVDVGLVQKDALVIDEDGTAEAWRRFDARRERLVAEESRWLREAGARLVLADIPPIGFEAAHAAGVRSVGLGNFSWDQIWAHHASRVPALAEAAASAARAYDLAECLLRLPFACDTRAFRVVEDVPLVARRPSRSKEDARARLRLDSRPVVLLSFGGVGVPGLRGEGLAELSGYQFLLTGECGAATAPNARRVDGRDLRQAGLCYVDLVAAADVVVTKPGYGIVSDCIGCRTPVVYTDRGDFPEYPVMVAEMPRYLPAVYLPSAELREARLGPALEAALSAPFPGPPRTDGAAVAADAILEMLAS
jgi:L-arabinokinase